MAGELMKGKKYDEAKLLYDYVKDIEPGNKLAIDGIENIKQKTSKGKLLRVAKFFRLTEGTDEVIVPDITVWNEKYSEPDKFNPKLEEISEYIITLTVTRTITNTNTLNCPKSQVLVTNASINHCPAQHLN